MEEKTFVTSNIQLISCGRCLRHLASRRHLLKPIYREALDKKLGSREPEL